MKKHILIGFVGTVILILIKLLEVLNGLFHPIDPKNVHVIYQIITIVYQICYLAVWIVIRELIVNHSGITRLKKPLLWMIIFVTISAILIVLSEFIVYKFIIYSALVSGLIELAIFIAVLIKLKNVPKKDFGNLRKFMISYIVFGILYALINSSNDIMKLLNFKFDSEKLKIFAFIILIPYVFLILFFNDKRKEVSN
jgi:hypothetical protein